MSSSSSSSSGEDDHQPQQQQEQKPLVSPEMAALFEESSAAAQYVWHQKHKLVLARVIRDRTRERLAYWSCYGSSACLAMCIASAAICYDTINYQLAFYQLVDGFSGTTMPYVVAGFSTMLSAWFFFGSFLCLWATATDYRVKMFRALQVYLCALVASFFVVLLLLVIIIVHRCLVDSMFKGGMVASMEKYMNKIQDVKETIDWMQIGMHCCGSSNYTDWWKVSRDQDNVPFSCCDPTFQGPCRFRSMMSIDPEIRTIYKASCTTVLRNHFASMMSNKLIPPLALALALIAVLTVGFRYLETSVSSVRDEERMDMPSIGFLWIRTFKYRVLKDSEEGRDQLHEEVEYVGGDMDDEDEDEDDDDDGDEGAEEGGGGGGGVKGGVVETNANASNDETTWRRNRNRNVSAAEESQLTSVAESSTSGLMLTQHHSSEQEPTLRSSPSFYVNGYQLVDLCNENENVGRRRDAERRRGNNPFISQQTCSSDGLLQPLEPTRGMLTTANDATRKTTAFDSMQMFDDLIQLRQQKPDEDHDLPDSDDLGSNASWTTVSCVTVTVPGHRCDATRSGVPPQLVPPLQLQPSQSTLEWEHNRSQNGADNSTAAGNRGDVPCSVPSTSLRSNCRHPSTSTIVSADIETSRWTMTQLQSGIRTSLPKGLSSGRRHRDESTVAGVFGLPHVAVESGMPDLSAKRRSRSEHPHQNLRDEEGRIQQKTDAANYPRLRQPSTKTQHHKSHGSHRSGSRVVQQQPQQYRYRSQQVHVPDVTGSSSQQDRQHCSQHQQQQQLQQRGDDVQRISSVGIGPRQEITYGRLHRPINSPDSDDHVHVDIDGWLAGADRAMIDSPPGPDAVDAERGRSTMIYGNINNCSSIGNNRISNGFVHQRPLLQPSIEIPAGATTTGGRHSYNNTNSASSATTGSADSSFAHRGGGRRSNSAGDSGEDDYGVTSAVRDEVNVADAVARARSHEDQVYDRLVRSSFEIAKKALLSTSKKATPSQPSLLIAPSRRKTTCANANNNVRTAVGGVAAAEQQPRRHHDNRQSMQSRGDDERSPEGILEYSPRLVDDIARPESTFAARDYRCDEQLKTGPHGFQSVPVLPLPFKPPSSRARLADKQSGAFVDSDQPVVHHHQHHRHPQVHRHVSATGGQQSRRLGSTSTERQRPVTSDVRGRID